MPPGSLSLVDVVVLVVAGVAAGFVNTLAGAGSLVTVPALMLTGLPADVANGSNRVCVLAQSLTATAGYDRAGALDRGAVLAIGAPAVLGATAGAWGASRVPEPVLRVVLLVTMVAIGVVLAARPSVLAPPEGTTPMRIRDRPLTVVALFAAGLYGGFIQAGVGILLLAILGGLLRYDLVRANALKMIITGTFTVFALAVFVLEGKVRWLPAGVLSLGSMVGAQLGVRFAVRRGQTWVRRILLVAVVALCAAVLWRS